MEVKLVKEYRIPVSLCDDGGKLSHKGAFALFMDLASEHGADMGLGMDELAKQGLIWLAVRTKIVFRRMPGVFEKVTVATWPREPVRARCSRFYTLKSGEEVLLEGKNEWAMMESATGRIRRISDVYPKDFVHCTDSVCEKDYYKISDGFSACEVLGNYTVTSQDTDSSRHMNNVEYIRAIFSVFSSGEIHKMSIKEIEIAYKIQCYEDENLTVKKRDCPGGFDIGIIKQDGKTACAARVITE